MAESKTYLFRAEAVNLSPTVYDTANISTIRGGGFYLLDRIKSLAQIYPGNLITEGASAAVFKFQAEEPETIKTVMLENLYADPDCIPEMMFLVEYITHEKPDDFASDMARLIGKIRLAQVRSANVRLFQHTMEPGRSKTGRFLAFDELNRVLPAHESHSKGEISKFTYDRMKQGVSLRQQIYGSILQEKAHLTDGLQFADDLETLSNAPDQGNLSGKIAYIYIDGNKFGALQRDFSEAELKVYDAVIQGFKRDFLAAIIGMANDIPSFKTNENKIRLETLLWGGDEIKLIVPAWLGWAVAASFFNCARNLEMPLTRNGLSETKQLTFALGLVFANHKNPIQNIGKIAEMLTGSVKKELAAAEKSPFERPGGDGMYYVVLESFETLPSDFNDFAEKYYSCEPGSLLLAPADLANLQHSIRVLAKGFPKSKLFEIIRAWPGGGSHPEGGKYADVLNRCLDLPDVPQAQKQAIQNVIETFTGTAMTDDGKATGGPQKGHRWIQISELWDYLTGEGD